MFIFLVFKQLRSLMKFLPGAQQPGDKGLCSFSCRVKMTGSCGSLSPDSKCFDHLLHLNSTWNAAV